MNTTDQVLRVPRAKIRPSPLNPRKHFDETKLRELGLNLRNNGVINPLTVRVRPGTKEYPEAEYELICGEQRWQSSAARAHPETGEEMPALAELPILIREMDDAEALEIMLSENMQRRDLTPMEECVGFERALAQCRENGERVYANQAALAEKIGVSRSYVTQRLSLAKLPKKGREALARGELSFYAARVVCGLPAAIVESVLDVVLHPARHNIWIGAVGYVKEVLTAEQAAEVIAERFLRRLTEAPFALDDASLLPVREEGGERSEGGACADCPWNSANREDEGEGRRRAPEKSCLNVACFRKKTEIHGANQLVLAKERGEEILSNKASAQILSADGELRHNAAYVRLDKKPDRAVRNEKVSEGKVPTWEKIVTGVATPPVVVAQSASGCVVRLVERKHALAAAQKNGTAHFLSLNAGGGRSAQQRDLNSAEAKARAEAQIKTAVSLAAVGAVVEKIAASEVPEEFWAWLADIAAWHGGSDSGNFVVKRRGLAGAHYSEAVAACAKKLKKPAEQRALAAELLVARLVKYSGIADKHFKWLGKIFGVDARAIEKRIRAEAAAKAKEKAVRAKAAEKAKAAKEAKKTAPAKAVKALAKPKKKETAVITLTEEDYEGGEWKKEAAGAVAEKEQIAASGEGLPSLSMKLEEMRVARGLEYKELDEIAKKACGRKWCDFKDRGDYEKTIAALLDAGPAEPPAGEKFRTKQKDKKRLQQLAQIETLHLEGKQITAQLVHRALKLPGIQGAQSLVDEWNQMGREAGPKI
jgi:ParB/RepB/Spo0J family partition protein